MTTSQNGRKTKKKKKKLAAAQSRPSARPFAVDIREAAAIATMSRSSLYNEIRDGELPAIKCRGATRILVADLHHYLQTRPPFGGAK